jgi:hypothetical protein
MPDLADVQPYENATNPFVKKGYGRVYVQREEDIKTVLQVMARLDDYEYTGYYPKGLVAVFTGEVGLIYTHKFELCMDALTAACWNLGIPIWCISQRNDWFRAAPFKRSDDA